MTITVDNLTWKIGRKTIINSISFEAKAGKMLGLLGPNGSGKTSLLRLIAGLRPPYSGQVLLDNININAITRRNMAKRVAFVEQHATTNANLKVMDVVKLGRLPHRSIFAGALSSDGVAVESALERTGMLHKRNESWQNLSGGERQRTQIARALAQAPRELILDEPTNHLDIQHQMSLLRLVAGLPITSIIAMHDLNHAAMFCDELIVMEAGKIIASGTPDSVITEGLLTEVFGVEARIETSPHTGRPHIHYMQ